MNEEGPETSDALESTWGYPDDGNGEDRGQFTPSLDDVRKTLLDEFGVRIWEATEAVISAKATLLISNIQACTGLVIVGPSGTGKTTTLQFIEDANHSGRELVYRCDDFTHAAFVSHDTSREEEELVENDLLPQVQHKTLAALDMNTWFSGSYETVQNNMSYLARVMDGQGLSRNTGGHGQRGYEGDYRFVLVAATTPLQTRIWDVMGNVGQRLLFHEMPREDDIDAVTHDVFGGAEYKERVARCQSVVADYLGQLWSNNDGYAGVDWQRTADRKVQEAIAYLANLVSHVRASIEEIGGRNEPQREGLHRVMMALRNLARGHALLCGRTEIEMEDVEVCARVALSTMHKERRGVVRAVLDPDTDMAVTASEIESHGATEASRKTILKRMELLNDLELGAVIEADNGRNTRTFALSDDFVWPNQLPFPE